MRSSGERTVLIIDDEPSIARSARRVLTDGGYAVETAATGREGLEKARALKPEVVLLDVRLPDASGLDLIRPLHEIDPSIAVIVITAFGDIRSAVDAMKRGAGDFLKKPYELEELLLSVEAGIERFDRDAELSVYRAQGRAIHEATKIVGASDAIRRVLSLMERVAASGATTVLIEGESGTGKELVARGIHRLSDRSGRPLVDVNCSSFQETLIENELFGHEKGAYTGAEETKRGLVEVADGGTLFLDEIGDMPLVTQAKLLRFIDQRTFRRVGGSADLSVDIRILAATNKRLAKEIEEERFREDLYYRLRVVNIQLPPLRERDDDVLLLASHFLDRMNAEFGKKFVRTDARVALLFRRYPWPGNVRELKNLIERVVLLEDADTLLPEHLPADLRRYGEEEVREGDLRLGDAQQDLRSLAEVEEEHLLKILRQASGNKSRAARILGISRQALFDKLRRMNAETEKRAEFEKRPVSGTRVSGKAT